MRREDRCAVTASLRGDEPAGTAITAHRFLLVEQGGPWGNDALTQSRLDPDLGRRVAQAGVASRTRVLLIRRPGRAGESTDPVWFLADTRPGRESIQTGVSADGSVLVELVEHPERSQGRRYDGPLFCVCTHGRHDACCAIRGRPLAAALAQIEPDATWECSHLGGDRFAANLLMLPHGLIYARVTPQLAPSLVEHYHRGLVDPGLLRGRSAFGPAVQAAQHHARAALHHRGLDGLEPVGAGQRDGAWTVVLADPAGGTVEVTVRRLPAADKVLLTCDAPDPVAPPAWHLERLARHPAAATATATATRRRR